MWISHLMCDISGSVKCLQGLIDSSEGGWLRPSCWSTSPHPDASFTLNVLGWSSTYSPLSQTAVSVHCLCPERQVQHVTRNDVIKNLHHCGQRDMLRAVTRLEFVKRKHNLAGMVESPALSVSPPMDWEACGQLLDGKKARLRRMKIKPAEKSWVKKRVAASPHHLHTRVTTPQANSIARTFTRANQYIPLICLFLGLSFCIILYYYKL